MLYHVRMDVSLPHNMDAATLDAMRVAETARCQALQLQGVWLHLWRVAGKYANISVFDVASHDELHAVLTSLPFFPYLEVQVTALARHPSAAAGAHGSMPKPP